MNESKTPVQPEPSDSERAEWREATENYVAWLETELAARDGLRVECAGLEGSLGKLAGKIQGLERELAEWKRDFATLADASGGILAVQATKRELATARSAIREAVELLERTRTCHFFVVPIRVTEVLAQLRSCLPAPDCAGAVVRGGEKERGTSEKGETI